MLKKIQLSIVASVIAAGSMLPTVAQAIRFQDISEVYFFGDSLTDSGYNDTFNTLPTPLGKAPTFTTKGGYIWSQYINRDIKGVALPAPGAIDTILTNNTTPTTPTGGNVTGTLTGLNYAAGGSTTFSTGYSIFPYAPSLHAQVGQYLTHAPATLDPRAVYFIWSGANDILKIVTDLTIPQSEKTERLLDASFEAATNISHEVALLSSRGAKRVVVMSLPNLGQTPFVRLLIEVASPGSIQNLKNLSFTYNSFINQRLGEVIKQYHTKVLYVDTYQALDDIISSQQRGVPYVVNGQSFNFVNSTLPVCGAAPPPVYFVPAIVCPNPALNFVFADGVHPTDYTHQALAAYVEQQILNWNA